MVLNLKEEEVIQVIPYPRGFDLLDCNLAYDPKQKNVYLLQHEAEGPENLWKINISEPKWTLMYEGLRDDTEIISTPNSDSCRLVVQNHRCFLIAPSDYTTCHPHQTDSFTFNVYKFDESLQNKIELIKPKEWNRCSSDEVNHALIIPKSHNNTKENTQFLIINKLSFINFVKEIGLNDCTMRQTLDGKKIPNDLKFNAENGAQAIRGGKILIFKAVDHKRQRFIDILDIKSIKVTVSHIGCPCIGKYDVILIENEEKEKKLTHGWIRNHDHTSMPLYLCDIITKFYCNDKILIIHKVPLQLSMFLWTEIPIDDVLDQDRKRARNRKYKWTSSINKW